MQDNLAIPTCLFDSLHPSQHFVMNRREGVFLGNNDKIRRALFQYF